jgi:hypothetical protein
MHKYSIGQRVPREGKTPLVVFECLADGRYAARTLRQTVKAGSISVEGREPNPGEVVTVGTREVIFVGPCPDSFGRWDTAYQDRIELTEQEIEEAVADLNARQIYSSVATRRERGGNDTSQRLRFLPRRTD